MENSTTSSSSSKNLLSVEIAQELEKKVY